MNVKKKIRMGKLFVVFCLIAVLLCGCTVKTPSTTIRVNKEFKENEIFYVEEEVCTLGEAKLFLMNQFNLYSDRYGDKIWKAEYEGKPLYTYLEENVYDFMVRLKSMVLMASSEGIVLSDDDQRLIDLAANNYYGKLTAAEKTYTGATIDDVKDAFSDYFLANKLFAALTKEAQREISDDEARVITVQVIFLEKGNDSLIQDLYQKATRDKEDFLTLAETYSKHMWIEGKVGRGELPKEVDEAAFLLTTGEISKVINCDEGLYLIKCVNNYEKELTANHREELIEKWKREMFKTEYDSYVQNLYMRVNENVWESIDFSYTAPKGKVSFYACYNEFLEGSE